MMLQNLLIPVTVWVISENSMPTDKPFNFSVPYFPMSKAVWIIGPNRGFLYTQTKKTKQQNPVYYLLPSEITAFRDMTAANVLEITRTDTQRHITFSQPLILKQNYDLLV